MYSVLLLTWILDFKLKIAKYLLVKTMFLLVLFLGKHPFEYKGIEFCVILLFCLIVLIRSLKTKKLNVNSLLVFAGTDNFNWFDFVLLTVFGLNKWSSFCLQKDINFQDSWVYFSFSWVLWPDFCICVPTSLWPTNHPPAQKPNQPNLQRMFCVCCKRQKGETIYISTALKFVPIIECNESYISSVFLDEKTILGEVICFFNGIGQV